MQCESAPEKAVLSSGSGDEKTPRSAWAAGDFGIFLHWGPYSVPAYDSVESARKRSIQNGSEWYLKRLIVKKTDFRPTSGWRETQAHHKSKYGQAPYSDFANTFRDASGKADFDGWMELFAGAGARYVVLTAKHHDGFCLWPTTTTANCAQTNLLERFRDAALKRGLRWGLYYSWGEFERSCNRAYLDEVLRPQVKELAALAPDLFWFDGDWMCATQIAQAAMDECCALIRSQLPAVQINDRTGHKAERARNSTYLAKSSTFRVYADRAVPAKQPRVAWEHCNTIGLSWGRNREQTEADYKPAEELLDLYRRVAALGGRFLLNVGPEADGSLCPIEAGRLKALGAIMGSKRSC